MKFREEYRDAAATERYLDAIARTVTRPWTIMEICGGQTHAILRYGIDRLLPPDITLIHGPGCPVCVTPVDYVDKAIAIAETPGAILCSYGDMLRVPGSDGDLNAAKACGADVRFVYSPVDALEIARQSPGREVVFFAVGFETTAPANAFAVYQAKREGLKNFSLLASHVLVPPAMCAILGAPKNRVQGFLAAGHVCTIMGVEDYEPIAARYRTPIVVTGFEPLDIVEGIYLCVKQLEAGRAEVENPYSRTVRREGNVAAQAIMREVYQVVRRRWRGIGDIEESGLALAEAYCGFDAEQRFGATEAHEELSGECIAGLVLCGDKKPSDCPAFGSRCTPERPLGVTMVSSEGACAAYYRYRRTPAAAE
jgi:hydrogenase expression/formation protein HypD